MSMLKNQPTQYLFIDIETVSKYISFDAFYEKEPRLADLWLKKSKKFYDSPEYKDGIDVDNRVYFDKASIYPEFGRIIAITLGFFDAEMNKRIKVISSENEIQMLKEFKDLIESKTFVNKTLFGHNIGSFDVPYIAKKFIFNGYHIPTKINTVGLKPWDLANVLFDTMDAFKLGSFEILSFDLLTACLNIDSPKTVIDGSMVNEYYWNKENGIETICEYNKGDVSALMDVALKLSNLENL
jgi:DNA polymerase elongation subunit (family B)